MLREKCPSSEYFLVRIFQHSDWIRKQITLFSLNTDQKNTNHKNSVYGHLLRSETPQGTGGVLNFNSLVCKMKNIFLMKTLTEDCLKFPTTNPHWFDCISRKRLSTRTVLKKFLWLHLWRSSNIKVGLSPSKIVFLICFNDSPSKMMKNEFYCILKALFVLKIFKFLSWHLAM